MPYMEWKTDHRLFAKKILAKIEESEDPVTYTSLQERSIEKGISLDVLDAALEHLHRFKKVKQKVKGDEIVYTAKPKPKQKGAKECLVQITNKKSKFFEALIYPLSEFKKEGKILYRYGAVVTPGYGENRVWFCPTDIGLPNNDLPLPALAQEVDQMPFPEWDLSWMFLTPDEMAEYKAQAKGMPLYLMQKKVRDRIKKATQS